MRHGSLKPCDSLGFPTGADRSGLALVLGAVWPMVAWHDRCGPDAHVIDGSKRPGPLPQVSAGWRGRDQAL